MIEQGKSLSILEVHDGMASWHDNLGPGNEEPEFYEKNTVLANDCQEGSGERSQPWCAQQVQVLLASSPWWDHNDIITLGEDILTCSNQFLLAANLKKMVWV